MNLAQLQIIVTRALAEHGNIEVSIGGMRIETAQVVTVAQYTHDGEIVEVKEFQITERE